MDGGDREGKEDKYMKGEPTLYLQLKTRIWAINVFESSDRQRNTDDDVTIPNVVCDVDIHDGGRFPPNTAAFELDSKIYLVGGAYVYELCPKTSRLVTPTAIPNRLKGPKVNPIAENINGKIHVLDRDLISPLCYEVLEFSSDSKSWTWNSLPSPPPLLPNSSAVSLYFVLGHKLSVVEESGSAAYFFDDSITKSWIAYPKPPLRPPPSPSPSAADSDLSEFQLMGGRTLRNCPGFDDDGFHVFVAYQGDFDVIGENKYLSAFLVHGGDGRLVSYQSLLPEETNSSPGDFYPEE